MNFAAAFGVVLKEHRLGAKLSQVELAHRANMHHTTISLYERGLREPSLRSVFGLSVALEISPSVLVNELGDLCPTLN